MASEPADPVVLSVVVPVRNGARFLPLTLPALLASDLRRMSWELIVVDDGSQDGSADIAAQYADRVVRLPASGGPPAARNRGIEVARGPVVVFVDADVCVHRDALRRVGDVLSEQRDLSAVFGAYDLAPADPSLVSQYRNLLHSYVHRRDAGEAVTFWTGLGAVRREVLRHSGGFDERERLDDVELGYRISALGHRIVLDPSIQGTHLKRWTLGSIISTDVFDRAVPWLRLFLRGHRPSRLATLNVRGLEQVLTALAAFAVVAMGVGLARGDPRWLVGMGLALAGMVVTDWRLLRWFASQRGRLFAVRAVPLRLLYFILNALAIPLALMPVGWRRREARQAEVPPGGWLGAPVSRGAKGSPPAGEVGSPESLDVGSNRAQPA